MTGQREIAFERREDSGVRRYTRLPPEEPSIVWVDIWLLVVTKHALRHWEVMRSLDRDLEWILKPPRLVLHQNDPCGNVYWSELAKLWANVVALVDEDHVRRMYEPVTFADNLHSYIKAMAGKGIRQWLHLYP